MADNGNVRVKLHNVRLSFPHLFTPQRSKKDKNATPKFNCSFLMDKNTKQGKKNIEAVKAAILESRTLKWGKNFPKLKPDLVCLRDGEPIDPDSGEREALYEGYEGQMYLSASNARRPTVLDRDGQTPLSEEDGVVYGGCYVNAIVTIWCQDNEYGKRVNCSLEGVQYYKKGEAFGAGGVEPGDFDDFSDEPEDDDFEEPRSTKKSRARDEEDEEEERPRRKSKPRARDYDDDDLI